MRTGIYINVAKRLRLGYARAARIMDELENMGIVGEQGC